MYVCIVASMYVHMYVFAYGPKTGPAFLRFFAFGLFRGGGGVGGWGGVINVLGFRPSRPSLRWICLPCVGARTSCCVGYVFSASLHTLHVGLNMSSLLRCTR